MPTKIERRRAVVTLYQGNYEQRLATLLDQALEAEANEVTNSTRRMGTKSKVAELAAEHDALLDEAMATAVEVTVWAISYTEFGPLQDEHPPREDEPADKRRGVNAKTFPAALLQVSLVPPGEADGLDDLKTKGEAALADLGDLSQVQYVKLENAAWNVNVGDDNIPKLRLASTLQRLRDQDSKPLSDSE